jgi:hypothetical protein
VVKLGEIAGDVGRGMLAGAVGTAAMTLSSSLEARLREREPSDAPATAAGRVLGVQPRNPAGRARFSTVVHWTYGSMWGGARGLIEAAGVRGAPAVAGHCVAVWGAAQIMLPALGVAPTAWKAERSDVAIDALHHAVYAVAAVLAFAALDDSRA